MVLKKASLIGEEAATLIFSTGIKPSLCFLLSSDRMIKKETTKTNAKNMPKVLKIDDQLSTGVPSKSCRK